MSVRGAVHDIGYKPYRGGRTTQGWRFLVIAKNAFAMAWRQKWGVRLPVYLTLLSVVIGGVFIYVVRYAARFARTGASPLLSADRVVVEASVHLAIIGFVLAARVAATTIADDLRVGAFQFYFSRTIRAGDYLAGKILGIMLVVGIPMLGGPVVLALFRVLLCDTWAELWDTIDMVPRALAFGLIGTAAYALPAAACGAIMKKRLPAQALFAVYYFMVLALAEAVAEALEWRSARLAAMQLDVTVIGRHLFNQPGGHGIEPSSAFVAVLIFSVVSLWLVYRRVSRAETAGLGSS